MLGKMRRPVPFEAITVGVIALLAVIGSLFHVTILQSFLPGAIGMKLVTATAFLLAALALIARTGPGTRAHVAALMLGSAVLVLGLLSLVQEATGFDLKIDRMWMAERPGAAETIYPGRMATNTAVAFVAFGGAMLLSRIRSRGTSVLARLLLLVVGVIAVQVLIGYVFSAGELKSSATTTPMALPTAINFALLAFAGARLRIEEWPMSLIASPSAAGHAARVLIPAGILITIALGWLRLRGQELGWYGTQTGTALYAMASVLALAALTLFITSRVHRMEQALARDQVNLQRALVAQDVIGTTRREPLLVKQAIVEQSCLLTGAAGAALGILENGHVSYEQGNGSATMLEGLKIEGSRSFAARSLLENRHAIVEDLSDEESVEREVRERMGAVSAALLPLRSNDQLLGTIVVFSEPGQRLQAEQLDLLRLIARPAAEALAQAHDFESRQVLLMEQAGELVQIQEQFTAFMANNTAATFIKDDSGRYVFANAAVSQFLGRDVQDVLGLPDEEILSPVRLESVRRNESEVTANGRTVRQVVHFEGAGSDAYWILQRFPIRIANGRQFLGGIAVDITEQKLAEEGIAELNATLEMRIAARTEELGRANAELEAFTYSVSHDLRSPLRAVSGYTRILEEDYAAALDAEAKRFLETIRSEAQRMGDLIDDLLSFSRIGRQSVSAGELDVAGLAREVFQEVRRQRPDRDVELVCGDLPRARADRNLIRQVLINLLSNSAKYAKPEGTIRIEVGASADEDFITYWVRDSGVGFDMRYQQKLFRVFQRLHSAEEFEGTGVGLAIVERIVSRHGGRVWGEGVVGEGATFYFTLPSLDCTKSAETEMPPVNIHGSVS